MLTGRMKAPSRNCRGVVIELLHAAPLGNGASSIVTPWLFRNNAAMAQAGGAAAAAAATPGSGALIAGPTAAHRRRVDQPLAILMSSQPSGVVHARSPGRSRTDVVAASISAGPSISWPAARSANS